MTRINLVDPSTLHTKHLVAEYRELPRVFGLAMAAEERGLAPHMIDIPQHFVLGTGHVKFFYNKLGWLTHRFHSLVFEMQARGYHPQHTNIPHGPRMDCWWNQWTPRPEDIALSTQRIKERTNSAWAD